MNEDPPRWLITACKAEYHEPEATRLAGALWQRILWEWHKDSQKSTEEDD